MGIVLSVTDGDMKARVFTSRGVMYFTSWSFRKKGLLFKPPSPGDLVEVILNETGALLSVREI